MDYEIQESAHEGLHHSSSIGSRLKLVAIHLGASNSNKVSNKQLELAKSICQQVMNSSRRSNQNTEPSQDPIICRDNNQALGHMPEKGAKAPMSAEEAAVSLVELMENEGCLNCGYGSNLNMHGKVECDAGLMSGHDQSWAGVGAVTGCKNPIRLAQSLKEHAKASRPLSLVQPNFLVATGAKQWMQTYCPHLSIPESHLISANSLSKYQDYKSIYDKVAGASLRDEVATSSDQVASFVEDRLDTVGSIAIDCDNNIASAVSSGGVVLKHRGRIGQASVPGAGCWAQEATATTTTGVGEYLTTTLFAKAFHDKLAINKLLYDLGQTSDSKEGQEKKRNMDFMISQAMNGCFEELLSSPALRHVPAHERLAGLLTVSSTQNNHGNHQRHQNESTSNDEQDFYLSYGHTTRSLCIGYMLGSAREASSFVSCMEPAKQEEEAKETGDALISPRVLVKTLKLSG